MKEKYLRPLIERRNKLRSGRLPRTALQTLQARLYEKIAFKACRAIKAIEKDWRLLSIDE